MMRKNGAAMAALAEAFPLTLPIFAGFWFIAFAYGFYMNTLGFSWVYPMAMAAIIFRRLFGIRHDLHAAFFLCPDRDIRHRLHRTGTSPLLRDPDAGEIRRHRLEETLPYLYAV